MSRRNVTNQGRREEDESAPILIFKPSRRQIRPVSESAVSDPDFESVLGDDLDDTLSTSREVFAMKTGQRSSIRPKAYSCNGSVPFSKSRAPRKRARQVSQVLSQCFVPNSARKPENGKSSNQLSANDEYKSDKAYKMKGTGLLEDIPRPKTAPSQSTAPSFVPSYNSFDNPNVALKTGYNAKSKTLQHSRYPLSAQACATIRPALHQQTLEDICFRGPPLCLKCGRMADKEMDRYRRVRAIGFRAIFDRSHRIYRKEIEAMHIRHVFIAWKTFSRLGVMRRVQAMRLHELKSQLCLASSFAYWSYETRRRATKRLQNLLEKLQLEKESTSIELTSAEPDNSRQEDQQSADSHSEVDRGAATEVSGKLSKS